MKRQSVFLRQQLFVEQSVQGSLLWRIALYSIACGIYFSVILIFTESMSNPGEPLSHSLARCLDEAIYWAPGLMLLIPVVAYDLLRLSNRFAGPIYRLRREMESLIRNESEKPVSFRDGDYWDDLAAPFNQLRAELLDLRRRVETYHAEVDTAENSIDLETQPASDAATTGEPPKVRSADETAKPIIADALFGSTVTVEPKVADEATV